MTITEVTDKSKWEGFLTEAPHTPYIQNWNAGSMYERLGKKIFRFGIEGERNELLGIAFVVKEVSRRGSFLFIPYGPILKEWKPETWSFFVQHLRSIAKKEGCSHIKCAPFIENTPEHKNLFIEQGFRDAPLHVLSELTLILDLQGSEDDIMSQMRKNTRNLIRRAEKDGVEIKISQDPNAMDRFLKLHLKTVQFHNFVPYSDAFFKEHLQSFAKDNQVLIIEGWHSGQLLASAVVMYYGNTASYRHGASEHSKIPAAYLVQWTAIREAKKRGLRYYNFWGIYDGENKKHPFYGISLFKKGFGGEKLSLLHCQDLPVSFTYWTNFWSIDMLRRYKRGFSGDSYE